jgi:hypothetical protein
MPPHINRHIANDLSFIGFDFKVNKNNIDCGGWGGQ